MKQQRMTQKETAYMELVTKRKAWTSIHPELTNPAHTAYDVDEIEPWAQWQNNLNAKVLVVGQEFCDAITYDATKGKVERSPDSFDYPSNQNLRAHMASLGLDPGHPYSPNKANPAFFTNCVMGLKTPPMSANFRTRWMKESRDKFLAPLIKIIQPRVIISIGSMATRSLGRLYGFRVGKLADAVAQPIHHNSMVICPVYHTGGLGFTYRSRAQQAEDWKRIAQWL